MISFKQRAFKFLFVLLLLTKSNALNRTDSLKYGKPRLLTYYISTLDVLYMVPEEIDDILNLNEKNTFGGSYTKGWILPAMVPINLNLYLYYDGNNQQRMDSFFQINSKQKDDSVIIIDNDDDSQDVEYKQIEYQPKAELYMYFTTETHCNEYKSHRPLEIVEKLGSNMYKAQLKDVSLPYSSKPYSICMQQFDTEVDSQLHDSKRFFSHQGDDYWNLIITTRNLLPKWSRVVIFFLLLCLSGLFSGLNLGLMSLDISELEILINVGTSHEQSYAKKIYPLRKRGNFLLCTILLGNVLVNTVSTLILGDLVSGIYAALGSTFLIVIFGEIIPQSACSKHGLAVGAYTIPIMYFFMFVTSPLSFPISKILNVVLGQELATVYGRDKIRELLRNVEDLGEKEFKIITGALDFNKKRVKDVMTQLDDVFMLELNDKLDFETIAKIAGHGFSRIPVYESKRDNIIGLLHVKDFTLLDPDDNMPVKAILEFYNHKIIFCDSDKLIDEMFEEFRMGETHLAFVTEVVQQDDLDPYVLCVGIITLEDILEELVQMEIYDEFDNKSEIEKDEQKEEDKHLISIKYHNSNSDTENPTPISTPTFRNTSPNASIRYQPKKAKTKNLELQTLANTLRNSFKGTKPSSHRLMRPVPLESQTSHDLSFFLQQDKDEKSKSGQNALISSQIRFVMFQFLWTTVKPFTSEFLTKNVLELIFKRCSVIEAKRIDRKSSPEYLYTYGRACNYFILILSGEATIEVGIEKLEFPAGSFAYFGVNALLAGSETADEVLQEETKLKNNENKNVFFNESKQSRNTRYYVPDFSLRVDDRCVYMKLDRELWRNGVIKSRYEIQNNMLSDQIDYNPPEATSNLGSTPESSVYSKIGTPVSYQASPSNTSLIKVTNGRRSTVAAEALAKAKQASNAKMSKSHSNTKLNKLKNKSDDSLIKKSLSTNSMKHLEASDSNSTSIDLNGNDKEPFLK